MGDTLRFCPPSELKIASVFCPCAFAQAFLAVPSFLSCFCVCCNPAHLSKPLLKWYLLHKAIPVTPLPDLEVGIYILENSHGIVP